MKEKFLSWQGKKRRELFLSCCGFDSYISFVGKKLLSAFGTVNSIIIIIKSFIILVISILLALHASNVVADAAHVDTALEPHEPLLAPAHAPAVLHQPVILTLLRGSIAHHQDSMAGWDAGLATGKNATFILLELVVGGHAADDRSVADDHRPKLVLRPIPYHKVVRDLGPRRGQSLIKVCRAGELGLGVQVRIFVLIDQAHTALN